jgi:hypothetical protein
VANRAIAQRQPSNAPSVPAMTLAPATPRLPAIPWYAKTRPEAVIECVIRAVPAGW